MSSNPGQESVWEITRLEGRRSELQHQVADLYVEYRDDVFRYLLTLGLHPPQAQEAAQEVFLKLYTTLRGNVAIENPKAWIFRVAHNHGLNVRAREKPQRAFEPDLEARLVAPGASAELTLLEKERTIRFYRAVENLSEQQRRCLHLRLEGLRYPEIGEVLGISASAVGEFMRRAIARLKRLTNE